MLKRWFKLLFSLMPDLTGFKEMGFEVHTSNGDLYVEKNTTLYRLRFSQGFEPFNPRLSKIVNFEIPDGFFMVEFLGKVPDLENVREELEVLFRHVHIKEEFAFFFNPRLDFGTIGVNIKAQKLIGLLESALNDR